MPKIKTNRSAAKRFKLTGTGKIRYSRMGKRHLLASKSRKRKRHLRTDGILGPADTMRIRRQLANSL
jgi:large subunit ribosomal protein L35